MHIVNTNYKTKIYPTDLNIANTYFENSKLYQGKPSMLRIKEYGATLLLFSSGTVRLMGKNNHDKLLQKILSILPNTKQVSPLQLMSHTIVHKINYSINLHLLNPYKFFSNQELFPSSIYIHKSSEHVNIFASGKIVITGVKSINNVKQLLEIITKDLENGCYTRN